MATADEIRTARKTELETALAQALVDEFGTEAVEMCREGAAMAAARGDELGTRLQAGWLRYAGYAEKILANA